MDPVFGALVEKLFFGYVLLRLTSIIFARVHEAREASKFTNVLWRHEREIRGVYEWQARYMAMIQVRSPEIWKQLVEK